MMMQKHSLVCLSFVALETTIESEHKRPLTEKGLMQNAWTDAECFVVLLQMQFRRIRCWQEANLVQQRRSSTSPRI